MKPDLVLVVATILVSLVGIPATVRYLVLVRGISGSGGLELLAVGLIAMLPGVTMGATSLWLAARS